MGSSHNLVRSPTNSALRTATLCFAFLLTGAATALLGVMLPVMLKQWHLTDSDGGSLLLLAWGGSTCGAVLFRGNLRLAAAAGLLTTSISMLALAAVNRGAALPLFAFYGVGLGIAMTAITLLSSQGISEAARRSLMMRLNLLWSAGACISPTLATHALSRTRSGGLFIAVGLVFCATAVAVFFSGNEPRSNTGIDETPRTRAAPLIFYAVTFFAVGVESAVGGWLTTFAGRTAHTELITLSATSAFWFGLLLSRAIHSMSRPRWLHSTPVLMTHATLVALATAALLTAPHSAAFVPSALLAGFGLGPLYPHVVALVVGNYKPRAVFVVAGVGSAALPWLTGTVSHAAGSLGAGLFVPCIGSAILLLLMLYALSRPSLRAR